MPTRYKEPASTIAFLFFLLVCFTVVENMLRPSISHISSTYLAEEHSLIDCIDGSTVAKAFLIADGQDPGRLLVPEARGDDALFFEETAYRTHLLLPGHGESLAPAPLLRNPAYHGYRFWQNSLSCRYKVVTSFRHYNDSDEQLVLHIDLSLHFMARLDARKEMQQLEQMSREIIQRITPCRLEGSGE